MPVVFASPHSGQDYPAQLVAEARLAPLALRRSEDSFVDELFAAAHRARDRAAIFNGRSLIEFTVEHKQGYSDPPGVLCPVEG